MELKAKTRQEVAKEYDISTKTLKKWLTKAQIDLPRGLIQPKDLALIYERFGVPKVSDSGR